MQNLSFAYEQPTHALFIIISFCKYLFLSRRLTSPIHYIYLIIYLYAFVKYTQYTYIQGNENGELNRFTIKFTIETI